MVLKKSALGIQYDHQNFFQIASIQLAGLGLLGVSIGKQLVKDYGLGTAIYALIIGNLLLWLTGIAILSMMGRIKSNAMDNIGLYLGKIGKLLTAMILLIAMLNWFAFEISDAILYIEQLFAVPVAFQKIFTLRFGAAIGFISSILSLGGIRLLRRIATISFPLLFLYYCYVLFTSYDSITLPKSWEFSFSAMIQPFLYLIPGVVNFPTFFRHSASRAHSILALTLITIFTTFFQIASIWWASNIATSIFNAVLISSVILLETICCNLINIYLAAACWETFTARLGEPKGFAILGLFGTLTYTFVQISSPLQLLQNLTTAYIAILGVVLVMAYLTRLMIQHRPRLIEKSIGMTAWIFGCIITTLHEAHYFSDGIQALIQGVSASILFFILTLFVEESIWAIKVKFKKNKIRDELKN